MPDRFQADRVAAAVFALLSVLAVISTVLALTAAESQNLIVMLVRVPGRFLLESFHLAAFYVPAVLAAAAVLLVARRVAPAHLVLLLASIAPFFTAAIAMRLVADAAVENSPVTSVLVLALGRGGAIAVSVLITLIQIVGMSLVWSRRGERSREKRSLRTIRALIAAPEPSLRIGYAGAPSEDSWTASDPAPADLPQSLVDLPEPEPRTRPFEVVYRDGRFHDDSDWSEPGATDDEVEPGDELEPDGELEPDDEVDLDDEVDPDVPLAGTDGGPRMSRPRSGEYGIPIDGVLQEYADKQYWHIDDQTREAAETLRITLDEFGIQAEVTGIRKGPVITMFEILPAPGVKLSRIVNLSDNIAMKLAASSVRIVAPIPGKHAVGIEIPNRERAIVGFGELLQEEAFRAARMEIPIALGKDIPGDAQIVDLTRMPHVLIAGATGSGKSVCVNSIICSILYRRAPSEVKLLLIDPKIVELKFYNDIPHLLTPVVTDPKRAFQALQYCIYEMERRYSLLDALQVRDVGSYNRKILAKNLATEPLPYIVVVVDEFADLMATSGKELESTLARLAAMSRAVGIHLVLATQRPSTDVITGLIKANIPSRIAFMVASKVDSRIILDTMGADKLLGRGDMLFTSAWDPFPVRMQGAFLSEEEVERVVSHVKQLGAPEYIDDEIFVDDEDEDYLEGELEDPLMEQAIQIVTTAGKASASYLQRRLKVGYNRAARMVEEMERLGIVGPQQGSKPRDIIGAGSMHGPGSFG